MKREAYLVSDQTHRRDEQREGSAERREKLDCKTRPRFYTRLLSNG